MAALAHHSPTRWWRRTVFWRLAALLIGVQVLIGVIAVGLSAYFAYEESLDLVENSLRLRLDALAEELERRIPDLSSDIISLPAPLVNDLATRFPDPLVLIDASGQVIRKINPDPRVFGGPQPWPEVPIPPSLRTDMESGNVVIRLDGAPAQPTYAVAPLYDAVGFAVGAVAVIPLDRSVDRELAETVGALRRALVVTAALAVLVAMLVGGLLTWRIIRPLRLMSANVERIGRGEYAARLDTRRDDEFGRLSESINAMATRVQESVNALVATDRLRRDLVANIGHDLRTPLGGILGYIEESRRALAAGDTEASRTSLESAQSQVRFVTRLVEDLFELSLLDSEAPPLRLEPVPLGELVQQAADAQRNLIQSDGKSFDVSIQSGLPTVQADGTRLLRLVQNLLDNARKHTPSGGAIRLAAEMKGAAVELHVADDGPGIDSSELANLFQRYYKGDSPRTRRGDGTGLGLAICQAIADAHGGSLAVESDRGAGTTFIFTLPVADAEQDV